MSDPKCLELAEYFLPDDADKKTKDDLAQVVQEAVDDFLHDLED